MDDTLLNALSDFTHRAIPAALSGSVLVDDTSVVIVVDPALPRGLPRTHRLVRILTT